MQSALTLIWNDAAGKQQELIVESSRFTIGRGEDNDLVIADAGLSRRHAVIESYDGLVQISDSDSRNGTFVNGVRVSGATLLRDGDLITFGSSQELRVRLAGANEKRIAPVSPEPSRPVSRAQPRQSAHLNPPLMAGVSLFVLIAGSIAAYLLIGRHNTQPHNGEVPVTPPATVTETASPSPGAVEDRELELIRREARLMLGRVSDDQNPYIFPPQALRDIQQRIREYQREPETLAAALRDLKTQGAAFATQIRQNSRLAPELVFYVALAETDGGRGNPLAAARRAFDRLFFLYATFGTDLANKTLILVAAYQISPGTEKTHPLQPKLQTLPLNEQNVWSLQANRRIDERTYDFVVRFLALGTIAQSPEEFGIKAPALVF
ncbi:MAG TPA: FHA domain-containing protein [Blastocatellia bacterium]|nr:FHA domain-containing protein [Blastocatellia bacterium]